MSDKTRRSGGTLAEIPPSSADNTPTEPDTRLPAPRRRFSLPVALTHRDYRLFWMGQAVSLAGSQMQVVATAWLLYQLTGSELALGLVGLFRAVPLVLFAIFGGVIADN